MAPKKETPFQVYSDKPPYIHAMPDLEDTAYPVEKLDNHYRHVWRGLKEKSESNRLRERAAVRSMSLYLGFTSAPFLLALTSLITLSLFDMGVPPALLYWGIGILVAMFVAPPILFYTLARRAAKLAREQDRGYRRLRAYHLTERRKLLGLKILDYPHPDVNCPVQETDGADRPVGRCYLALEKDPDYGLICSRHGIIEYGRLEPGPFHDTLNL